MSYVLKLALAAVEEKKENQRILDDKYLVLRVIDGKDSMGLSIVEVEYEEKKFVAKVMGYKNKQVDPKFEKEAQNNGALPEGNPRLVKATTVQYTYDGQPPYDLEGDYTKLENYSYLLTPFYEKGSLLDVIVKLNQPKLPPSISSDYNMIKYSLCADAVVSVITLFTKTGLCHKDIKSDNFVIVEQNPNVLLALIDFGSATKYNLAETDGSEFNYYSPPEAINKNKPINTEKLDVFCLGALMISIIYRTKQPFVKYWKQPNRQEKEGYKGIEQIDNCTNDEEYKSYFIHREHPDSPLDFFNKYPQVHDQDVNKDALKLIIKMIDEDPENRPTLQCVWEDPFIIQYSQSLNHVQRRAFDAVINFV